jgi:hypothetical protein
MLGYIRNFYPGTKLSISEYELIHYPGEPVIDALVLADALGVFGAYDVQVAALFDHVTASDPWANSFLLYRNYDGAGGRFGDQSVAAKSTDPSKLSIYAARRSADGKLTVVVINKEPVAVATKLTVSGFPAPLTGESWSFSRASPAAIVPGNRAAVAGNVVTATFPAYSATELILSSAIPSH